MFNLRLQRNSFDFPTGLLLPSGTPNSWKRLDDLNLEIRLVERSVSDGVCVSGNIGIIAFERQGPGRGVAVGS